MRADKGSIRRDRRLTQMRHSSTPPVCDTLRLGFGRRFVDGLPIRRFYTMRAHI